MVHGIRVLAALALALSSCALLRDQTGISLSTDPPGATVLVDGKNSGFVTPCMIGLDANEDIRIDLKLDGYRTETRWLTPDRQVYALLWHEMYIEPEDWHFPLFLNMRDFVVPVKSDARLAPGRVYVRLDRLSDDTRSAAALPAAK